MNKEELKLLLNIVDDFYLRINCNESNCPLCLFGNGFDCKISQIMSKLIKMEQELEVNE